MSGIGKTCSSVAKRFWAKVRKTSGCWEWTATKQKPTRDILAYGQFRLNGSMKKAHRVAYELTVGPIPDGQFVLHKCDNPGCVRPSHLMLGSGTENMLDMYRKGRHQIRSSKLDFSKAEEIRQAYAAAPRGSKEATRLNLAKTYGVSARAIRKVVDGHTWSEARKALA